MKQLIAWSTIGMFGLVVAAASFAGILLDGKSDDWDQLPVLISDRDNLPNYFPQDVAANYSDRVDIKEIKALVSGSYLYVYLKLLPAI